MRSVQSSVQSLGLAVRLFLPEKASPKKTAANITKTTPMPDESRAKSTIATMRNKTSVRALPRACFDTSQLVRARVSFRETLLEHRAKGFHGTWHLWHEGVRGPTRKGTEHENATYAVSTPTGTVWR